MLTLYNPKNVKKLVLFLLLLIIILVIYHHEKLGWLGSILVEPFSVGTVNITLLQIIRTIFFGLILLWVAITLIASVEKRVKKLSGIKESNKSLFIKILQIAVYALFFILFLDIIGIDITAFAFFGGALGIGIGFGMQKITSNFISGIVILLEKSLKIKDLIELEDGTLGVVTKIGARYTLIETFENREIMIPNEDIITSRLSNWTHSNSLARVKIDIGVAYGTDLHLARKIMLGVVRKHPHCAKIPQPEFYLIDFADNSIILSVRFWVLNVSKGRLRPKSDIMMELYDEFNKNNIDIPFPQRVVHLKKEDGPSS